VLVGGRRMAGVDLEKSAAADVGARDSQPIPNVVEGAVDEGEEGADE